MDKAALLAGLLVLAALPAAASSTAPAVSTSTSTHWKAALSRAASPAASRFLLPPILHATLAHQGADAYAMGKSVESLHRSVVLCGEYLEKLAAAPPSEENSKQRATYSQYMQRSRASMARSLALLQDALQRRPALKDYEDKKAPAMTLKTKGDPFLTRLPREEDFGLPVKDPFDVSLSSDGVKAGNLEFTP